MYMYVYVCVHVGAVPVEASRRHQIPWNWIYGAGTPGLLQEQYGLLTAMPSLQAPISTILKCKQFSEF